MISIDSVATPNANVIGSVLICLLILLLWQQRARGLSTMTGPKGYPLIGIGLSLPPRAPKLFREWALEYGEVFKLRVGWYNWVVINSPEAFKEILDKQVSACLSRQSSQTLLKKFTNHNLNSGLHCKYQSISTSSKTPSPIGNDLVAGNMRMFTMPYGPKWRTYRALTHQLLSPKMTLTFVPSQEFEVKQFLYELACNNSNLSDFYQHVRRLSFSIIMTSAYGRRIDSWDHEDVRSAGETSQLLGRITRPGAFIEDDIPPLANLPHWMQPSRKTAMRHAETLLKAKMRAWNQLKRDNGMGKAAPSFGKDLMDGGYKLHGLCEEDGAWIVGG